MTKANLAAVLSAVRPGRVLRLDLTDDQKRELADAESRLAVDVVRHLLGARAASAERPAEKFPLTEATFQAVARRLGRTVGIKRSRLLLRRLIVSGVIETAGSYRQPYRRQGVSGFRVRLFRIGVLLAPLRRKRLIGRSRPVERAKRPRWWSHPLFGDLDGLPPPQLGKARAARMRSLDEQRAR